MREGANLTSIGVLREFKHAYAEFGNLAKASIGEAQARILRARSWLEHDRPAHWERERRKRVTRLDEANAELFRAQVSSSDQLVPQTLQRRAVDKAKRALEEAETKLRNLKRWRPILEREGALFKARCEQLASAVEGDLPRALARLERMSESLEKYVRLAAPTPPEDDAAPPDPPGPPGPAGPPEEETTA